jgi:hypothetical protein
MHNVDVSTQHARVDMTTDDVGHHLRLAEIDKIRVYNTLTCLSDP